MVTTEKATAWVVKKPENDVIAFTPQCMHLGCPYHWDDPSHTFVCPCHTSVFSIDGKVLSGPAPRPIAQAMRMAGHSKADMTLLYTLEVHAAQQAAVEERQKRMRAKVARA
jgi:Rieske Fe-S protein